MLIIRLLPILTLISHNSFSNLWLWMALEPFLGWTIVKKNDKHYRQKLLGRKNFYFRFCFYFYLFFVSISVFSFIFSYSFFHLSFAAYFLCKTKENKRLSFLLSVSQPVTNTSALMVCWFFSAHKYSMKKTFFLGYFLQPLNNKKITKQQYFT